MIQPYPMMQLESFEDALMEPMINNDNSDKPSMIFFMPLSVVIVEMQSQNLKN